MAWTSTRAAIAAECHMAKLQGRAQNAAHLAELRQKLRVERAELYVRDLLAAEPPLSDDQLGSIARLVLTGVGGGNAAT